MGIIYQEIERERQQNTNFNGNRNISNQKWDKSREIASDQKHKNQTISDHQFRNAQKQFERRNLVCCLIVPNFSECLSEVVCFFWTCLIFLNLQNVCLNLSEFSEFWSDFDDFVWILVWIYLNASEFVGILSELSASECLSDFDVSELE